MSPRHASVAGIRQPKRRGATAVSDPAKVMVMACIGQCVADSRAEWRSLGNGEIRVCFSTGETFLLAESGIVRLA